MSLKRKIRFTNLPTSSNPPPIANADAETFSEDSKKSGVDPFAFPGQPNSETSSLASNSTQPPKMGRLVLKLGSSRKAAPAAAPPVETPLLSLLRSPPRTDLMPELLEEPPVPPKRWNKKRKSSDRKKKAKKRADDVSVQELLTSLEDAQDATSSQANPEFQIPLVPSISSDTLPSFAQEPSESNISQLTDQPSTPPLASDATGRSKDPFEQLLYYYLTHLERKDLHKFFHFPITDMLAPNYSAIVKHSMDFSTMRKKLSRGWYENLTQFKGDFDLICINAMTYNAPDTIYYRSARKISRAGAKLMNKDRLSHAKRAVPGFDSIPAALLTLDRPRAVKGPQGIPSRVISPDLMSMSHSENGELTADSVSMGGSEDTLGSDDFSTSSKFRASSLCGPYENIPQENAEEILQQLRLAGKEVADRLAARKTQVVMPLRLPDGTISLNILNPDNKSNLTIGGLAGPLKSGSIRLPRFNQQEVKIDASSVFDQYYKDYGVFSTHAPVYNSKGAVFTKEETDLIRTAYGSEKGIAYTESLLRWGQQVKHRTVKKSIEKLLNDASGGEHSEVVMLLNERILTRIEEERGKMALPVAAQETVHARDLPRLDGSEAVTAEALAKLRELANDGIDVSFLDAIGPDELRPTPAVPATLENDPANLLNLNGEVLHQLYLEQTKRLVTASTSRLASIPGPGETECALAEEALTSLSKLIALTKPADVVSSVGVRKAMNLI